MRFLIKEYENNEHRYEVHFPEDEKLQRNAFRLMLEELSLERFEDKATEDERPNTMKVLTHFEKTDLDKEIIYCIDIFYYYNYLKIF